jgi:hypothetical protein
MVLGVTVYRSRAASHRLWGLWAKPWHRVLECERPSLGDAPLPRCGVVEDQMLYFYSRG